MKNHISSDIYEQMVSWRHHLHQYPETGMKEKETAGTFDTNDKIIFTAHNAMGLHGNRSLR